MERSIRLLDCVFVLLLFSTDHGATMQIQKLPKSKGEMHAYSVPNLEYLANE